ncbi:MAG: M14 family metallopeptidase, partial [Gemmatimonadota bacterium]|nr:M14 family metallopeptidase [Gemmatimonadota bacterium]
MPKISNLALRRHVAGTAFAFLGAAVLAPMSGALAQQSVLASITTPRQQFGHDIGDDYWLATYDQFEAYWRKLAGESDRMKLVEIGKSEEGRPQLMAIISSPENMKHLARYQEIAQKLAHAEGLTDDQAHALAAEGKAVVWIDGGLHASEVLGAHQLMQTVYDLLARNDAETRRILDDCIILAVHANPDGMQLISSWYMKDADSTKRNMDVPRLWQKYTGHDNNRDFYMSNQAETKNINHVLYWDWFPQIVYNHHQTGPAGAVMFSPPFRDPFNYNFDPMIATDIDMIGAAMHDRFAREHKPGVVMRSGATYSTWWNGGLRTSPYFHNMIGLLTETIGSPTPQRIPFVPDMSLPRGDVPYPITPQEWHFRQSIDYSVTANYAVLDLASRYKDEFLYDIFEMGRNSIEKGSRDSWTISGARIAAVDSAVAADRSDARVAVRNSSRARIVDDKYFTSVLRNPAERDPRGYIISADQPDFLTATKFVNALRHNGVTVLRATAPFSVNGKRYPEGSFVVKTGQAFRPQVLDMFEPQDYPNDFASPGGPPIRPYDNTGYTLAYQMGVQFDRVLDGFEGPFAVVGGLASPPVGTVADAAGAAGFLFSHAENDAFTVVNRLLKKNADVYWLRTPVTAHGRMYPAGTFYVSGGGAAMPILERAAKELGVSFQGTTARPGADATRMRQPRLALWDTYGGSMPSGQIRFILDQFEFPYTVVYPQDIDAGKLSGKFDALILPSGAINGSEEAQMRAYIGGARDKDIPKQYQHMTGSLTAEKSAPALGRFLRSGGTVVAIGGSTSLAYMLDLPLANALIERSPTGGEHPLSNEKFYVPGSILGVAVNDRLGIAAGAPSRVDVFFDNSPAFRLQPDAQTKGVTPIAWFDSAHPLRSGWAWGQNYLDGTVAMAQAKVGDGQLFLFGPEITFRAQPHGTFRFLFNGIYNGGER